MPVFTKSRQHVCHVRRKIQMSDVGFVKIIIIWCLRLPIGRVKSIREDWNAQNDWKTPEKKYKIDFKNIFFYSLYHFQVNFQLWGSEMPSCNMIPYQWCVYWLLGLSEDLREGLKINR